MHIQYIIASSVQSKSIVVDCSYTFVTYIIISNNVIPPLLLDMFHQLFNTDMTLKETTDTTDVMNK